MPQGLAIFSGRANLALASKVCLYVGVQPGCIEVSNFSDGEIYVQIEENVRGRDVFVIQSTCPPVNENLMELLIMIDALKRSSARRITAVIPYFGYARQDKKDAPRVPISAKLVADLIDAAGADRVLAMDLHTAQLQGFSISRWTICSPARCSCSTSNNAMTSSSWSFPPTPVA